MPEDVSSSSSAVTVMLGHTVNGAPSTVSETNFGELDYGRVIQMSGSDFITTATSSRKVAAPDAELYTEYATIGFYNSNFTLQSKRYFGNATDRIDGSTSWLLNGVEYNGSFYFAGKSDVMGTDLCPLDNLPALAVPVSQPYVLKYHMTANGLVLDACTRIDFVDSSGVSIKGEISGIAVGDGRVFVGGATRGKLVNVGAGSALAVTDAVGRNDPQMYVGKLWNDDAFVASFDVQLLDLAVLSYGTKDWEEILDLQYDPDHKMIYTVGSTHGDLCTAYSAGTEFPTTALSTQGCITGAANTSTPILHDAVTFDGYVAAIRWKPGATQRLEVKALRQFGVDKEDTFNGLALFRDTFNQIAGGAYLYFAGKYTPPAAGHMDARLMRMHVAGGGGSPDAILLDDWTLQTYVRGVAGSTDVAGAIAVTPAGVYATGARNGALGTHSGPCGGGPDSHLIPMVESFPHAPQLMLNTTYELLGPAAFHRTGEVKAITIDTISQRFVAYGSTNYSAEAYCGDPTSPAFIQNKQLGGDDDNMHELDATLFYHPL